MLMDMKKSNELDTESETINDYTENNATKSSLSYHNSNNSLNNLSDNFDDYPPISLNSTMNGNIQIPEIIPIKNGYSHQNSIHDDIILDIHDDNDYNNENDGAVEVVKRKKITKIISKTTTVNGIPQEKETQEYTVHDSHNHEIIPISTRRSEPTTLTSKSDITEKQDKETLNDDRSEFIEPLIRSKDNASISPKSSKSQNHFDISLETKMTPYKNYDGSYDGSDNSCKSDLVPYKHYNSENNTPRKEDEPPVPPIRRKSPRKNTIKSSTEEKEPHKTNEITELEIKKKHKDNLESKSSKMKPKYEEEKEIKYDDNKEPKYSEEKIKYVDNKEPKYSRIRPSHAEYNKELKKPEIKPRSASSTRAKPDENSLKWYDPKKSSQLKYDERNKDLYNWIKEKRINLLKEKNNKYNNGHTVSSNTPIGHRDTRLHGSNAPPRYSSKSPIRSYLTKPSDQSNYNSYTPIGNNDYQSKSRRPYNSRSFTTAPEYSISSKPYFPDKSIRDNNNDLKEELRKILDRFDSLEKKIDAQNQRSKSPSSSSTLTNSESIKISPSPSLNSTNHRPHPHHHLHHCLCYQGSLPLYYDHAYCSSNHCCPETSCHGQSHQKHHYPWCDNYLPLSSKLSKAPSTTALSETQIYNYNETKNSKLGSKGNLRKSLGGSFRTMSGSTRSSIPASYIRRSNSFSIGKSY